MWTSFGGQNHAEHLIVAGELEDCPINGYIRFAGKETVAILNSEAYICHSNENSRFFDINLKTVDDKIVKLVNCIVLSQSARRKNKLITYKIYPNIILYGDEGLYNCSLTDRVQQILKI